MLDGDNSTCFGFADRHDLDDSTSLLILVTLNVFESMLKIRVDNATSCAQFQNEIIVSTFYKDSPCSQVRECHLVNDDMQDDTCVVRCRCWSWPCKMYLYFLPDSTIKICEMSVIE